MKPRTKLPTVVYKTVIVINGKEYVQSSMSYTESVGELITNGLLENEDEEIIAHINDDDN